MNKVFSFLFSYKKIELKTRLSKERVLDKISKIEPDDYFGGNFYYSKVSEDSFKVCERTYKKFGFFFYSRNSFAPLMSARLEERDGYTLINAIIRPRISVMIFLAIWLAFMLLGLLLFALFVTGAILGEATFTPEPLIILIFPVFYSILMYFGFHRPAERLREYIEHLLVCE